MEKYSDNTMPSPDDTRDWVVESIYKPGISVPNFVDHSKHLQPIRDQGNQGSCAAQTAACIKEWQEYYDIGYNNYMSPQFIYNNRVNQDSDGMFGRDVMRILSKIGCCFEITYPYNLIESPSDMDMSPIIQANKYKIKAYAQIKTIDGLKKALHLNGPCYISFPIFNHSPTMWKPNDGEKRIGGHAMTVVGYDNNCFKIRNSWGKFWGDEGYCYYSYSDWGSHWEIWTTIDDKSYIQPPEKPEQEIEVVEPSKCCFFF